MTNKELKLTLILLGLKPGSSYDFYYEGMGIFIPAVGRVMINTPSHQRNIRYGDPAKALRFIERYMDRYD